MRISPTISKSIMKLIVSSSKIQVWICPSVDCCCSALKNTVKIFAMVMTFIASSYFGVEMNRMAFL